MSKNGYFLDLTMEFDDAVKNKLIKQHETIAKYLKDAAKKLGASQIVVKMHKETASGVIRNSKFQAAFTTRGFRRKEFRFDCNNEAQFHTGIATIQFYLITLQDVFMSVHMKDTCIAALNAMGAQDDEYTLTGTSTDLVT